MISNSLDAMGDCDVVAYRTPGSMLLLWLGKNRHAASSFAWICDLDGNLSQVS
jgi:hypothetical protein